jgi:hypothetical protein
MPTVSETKNNAHTSALPRSDPRDGDGSSDALRIEFAHKVSTDRFISPMSDQEEWDLRTRRHRDRAIALRRWQRRFAVSHRDGFAACFRARVQRRDDVQIRLDRGGAPCRSHAGERKPVGT